MSQLREMISCFSVTTKRCHEKLGTGDFRTRFYSEGDDGVGKAAGKEMVLVREGEETSTEDE